jgi:RNA polymerase sigma factor (sigma-70 family)
MVSGRWQSVFRHVRELLQASNSQPVSDRELLDRFVSAGDQDAFALLLERHGPKVMGVCRHLLRDTHRADDAFQATFLVFVRKAGTIRKRQSVGSWLYGVAFRTALKARTRAQRIQAYERQVDPMPTSDFRAEALEHDVRPMVLEEIHRLPEKYQAPVLLCYFDGKSEQEAAEELRWPAGTVRARMARARELLRSRLARRGLALSTAQLVVLLAGDSLPAAVPVALVNSTLEAVGLLVAGQSVVPALISAEAATLAAGVLKSMWIAKLRIGASLVMVVAALGLAVGVMTHAAQTESDESASKTEAPPRSEEPKLRASLKHFSAWFALSPDGKTLAQSTAWEIGENGIRKAVLNPKVKFWDVATGRPRALEGPTGGFELAFSRDGAILATVNERPPGVKLWDVATGKERSHLHDGRRHVDHLLFSPDGKTLVTVGNYEQARFDPMVKLWNVTSGKERMSFQTKSHQVDFAICSIAISPDGKTLATAGETLHGAAGRGKPIEPIVGTVKLWEMTTGKLRATVEAHTSNVHGHTGRVCCCAFSPDGQTLASASDEHTVKLWDLATGKERAILKGHPDRVRALAFSPDGRFLASGSLDGAVKIWDMASGKVQHTIKVLGGCSLLAYSSDCKILAAKSGDDATQLWELPATRRAGGRPRPVVRSSPLSTQELDRLWDTLAEDDAAKAYAAMRTLASSSQQAIALTRERLRESKDPQLAQLIADLDSDEFATRKKAQEELERKVADAEPLLRKKLAGTVPSLELRRRLEQLLSRIDQQPSVLRQLRAVEVLELIGSLEARQVLQMLANRTEGTRLTADAKAALERLNTRAEAGN